MTFEPGRGILRQFPFGYTTSPADPIKPFVSKPARRPAVSGIGDHKRFIAMGRDTALIANYLNCLDSVQQPFARRPKFDFFNKPKKFHPFAVVAFGRLFI